MRTVRPFLFCAALACQAMPPSNVPTAPPSTPPLEPQAAPEKAASPSDGISGSWLLWPSSGDQVEVVGTWIDGEWVGGRDAPPAPVGTHPLVSLSGADSGSLHGGARTVCDQLLMKYEGPFVGNDVVLLSPEPAHPRPVTDVEAEASDRSLAAQVWPGQADLQPDEVRVSDLDGDGVAERIAVFAAIDEDGVPQRSAVVVVSDGGSPAFSGWPGPPERPDLADAGVPTTAHRVELKGIADVDGDGSLEVVAVHHLDGLHYHGLVIYSFSGGQLMPIGSFAWGERDCHPPSTWSET